MSVGDLVDSNGTKLYFERRGGGPPVLLVAGATGEAGSFEELARQLADEFEVVTYDRRGYSRSPRPAGWNATSIAEQADDAAGLLAALGLAPAAVFGTSAGAIIALEVALRRPELVSLLVLHEPFVVSLLGEKATEVRAQFGGMIERALQAGGPRAATEAMLRAGLGDEAFDRLEPDLRERLLANAETLIGVDFQVMPFYEADEDALAGISAPIRLLVQEETAFPFIRQIAERIAVLTGGRVLSLAGPHVSYMPPTPEFTQAARAALRLPAPATTQL
jgi:pimeloyl-ACP methyl ester carboxylesterase